MKEIELPFDFNASNSGLEEYRISIPKGFKPEINKDNVILKKEYNKDERIRKELVNYFTEGREFLSLCSFGRDKILAWLEKQGEQTNLPQFTFDDVLALQCCMETVKKVQEDKDLYEKLNDIHSRVYDAYQLEKQGEQKPADKKEPKFKVGNTIKYVGERKELAADKYTIKEICNDCYITTCGSKIPFRMQEYYVIVNDTKELKKIETPLPSFDEQQGTPVIAYNKEYCQNAAWSEEDEKMFDKTLYLLDAGFNNFKCTDGISESKEWVKSVKRRLS